VFLGQIGEGLLFHNGGANSPNILIRPKSMHNIMHR
jgi:hypothetical protein